MSSPAALTALSMVLTCCTAGDTYPPPLGVVVLGVESAISGAWTERMGHGLAFLSDGRLIMGAPSYVVGEPIDQADDVVWVTSEVAGVLNGRGFDTDKSIVLNDVWGDYELSPAPRNGFGFAVAEVGDVTGDGISDIAASEEPGSGSQPRRWAVFGGPDFDAAIPLASLADMTARADPCGDVNGDGISDLCTAEGVYFGPVERELAPQLRWFVENAVVSGADMDDDGRGELILSDARMHSVHHLVDLAPTDPLSPGEWSLPEDASATWTSASGRATALAVGDLDGDGEQDLIVGWFVQGASVVVIGLPESGGDVVADATTTLPVHAQTLAVGDFNGDLQDDLAVGGEGEVSVWLGPLVPGPMSLDDAHVRFRSEQSPDSAFGMAVGASDAQLLGHSKLAIGAPDEIDPDDHLEDRRGRVWLLDGVGL